MNYLFVKIKFIWHGNTCFLDYELIKMFYLCMKFEINDILWNFKWNPKICKESSKVAEVTNKDKIVERYTKIDGYIGKKGATPTWESSEDCCRMP